MLLYGAIETAPSFFSPPTAIVSSIAARFIIWFDRVAPMLRPLMATRVDVQNRIFAVNID